MKEAFLILLVVFILLALTAVRYRKQITGMIGLARMLKQAKKSAKVSSRSFPEESAKSTALVNCSKCDIWVPQDKAVKFREGFICSEACIKALKTS